MAGRRIGPLGSVVNTISTCICIRNGNVKNNRRPCSNVICDQGRQRAIVPVPENLISQAKSVVQICGDFVSISAVGCCSQRTCDLRLGREVDIGAQKETISLPCRCRAAIVLVFLTIKRNIQVLASCIGCNGYQFSACDILYLLHMFQTQQKCLI